MIRGSYLGWGCVGVAAACCGSVAGASFWPVFGGSVGLRSLAACLGRGGGIPVGLGGAGGFDATFACFLAGAAGV